MRVLFVHPNFPAQYRQLASALGSDPANEVVYLTRPRPGELPGVRKVAFAPWRAAGNRTHHYVRNLETAVLNGQAVYRAAAELKRHGFQPDVICGHIGWGVSVFLKDLFPETPLLLYAEWYYRAQGADSNFDPEYPQTEDDLLRIRAKNASLLLALAAADALVTPTEWQRLQFPPIYRGQMTVLHDGIDTDFYRPAPQTGLRLPNLDLSHVDEIVTYVARGQEPHRGFPKLIEAVALLQQRRPRCHVVIVGEDRVCYGRSLEPGDSYRSRMLEKVSLDLSRVHFTGYLSPSLYRKVLQASSVHIYLTYPFVLSWSLLEAMATGCLVVASDTAPVREVLSDGETGLLVDFFDPEQLAARVDEVLSHPTRMAELRARARRAVVERFDLALLLPLQLQLVQSLAGRRPATYVTWLSQAGARR